MGERESPTDPADSLFAVIEGLEALVCACGEEHYRLGTLGQHETGAGEIVLSCGKCGRDLAVVAPC